MKDPGWGLGELVEKLGEASPGSHLAIVYEGVRPEIPNIDRLDITLMEAEELEGYLGKNRNLATALRNLDLDRYRYVVFIDDDIIPHAKWIGALIQSCREGVSTGYRVYSPREAPLLLSLWSIYSLDTMLSRDTRIVWGGSACFTRDFLDVDRLLQMWRGAVSDDVAYTYLARERGIEIGFNLYSLVRNIGIERLRDAISFIIRQQRIVYVYSRWLWRRGVAYHGYVWLATLTGIYNILFPSILGLLEAVLTLILHLLYMFRLRSRCLVASKVVRDGSVARIWIYAPLILLIQLPLLLLSRGRDIIWRGARYTLPSPEELGYVSPSGGGCRPRRI